MVESAKNRPIVAGSDADTDAALGFDIAIPLVIDLDSTLLATDTLHESLLLFLKRRPTSAWQIPIWALSGREALKNRLADVVTDEDVATFPARQSLVTLAENEAARGRKIVLATAADLSIAEKIRNRFSFIREVVASSAGHDLKGAPKAEALHALFRTDSFMRAIPLLILTFGIGQRPRFLSAVPSP